MCKEICKTSCPPIPKFPQNANINQNIEEALKHVDPRWLREQVKNKARWDYKQQGREYEDFGNYNFGAVCKAVGVPESYCLREAGRGQQAAGTSKPEWGDPGNRYNPFGGTPPYGDDPNDQEWIKKGFKYFDEYMKRKRCGCAPQ